MEIFTLQSQSLLYNIKIVQRERHSLKIQLSIYLIKIDSWMTTLVIEI